MKTITIFLILFFCLQLNANSNIIKSADSAYQSQNYLQAIGLYNQALSNYQQSAYLYYNLGNAYYKNNEIGKSIWAYHKAKKIDPQQKDISYNLNYVSSLTKDKIEQNSTGVSKWIAKVFFGRSINFWAYMAFIFLTMSALFFYLFKISKEKNKRGVFLMISIAAVFLFLTSFTISVAHKTHISSLSHGIVIEPVAKVRTAPHQENAIAFELHEGAKFTYKETQGNWLRIEVGKEEGWINKETSLLY